MIQFLSRLSITALAASMLLAAGSGVPDKAGRVPVLVELFTSEGCSSCPPADKLLEKLDRDQPVAGIEAIVLSEHVDYWNHLGWSDPYSSAQISQRQQDYASRLGSEVYTPQVVIDGASQTVGSNWPGVKHLLEQSARQPKIEVSIRAQKDGSALQVHLETGSDQAGSATGTVYLAIAADRAQSQVARGENAGRTLDHVAVAYTFQKLGNLAGNAPFQKDVRVALNPKLTGNVRVIGIVQNAASRRIIGVAETQVSTAVVSASAR